MMSESASLVLRPHVLQGLLDETIVRTRVDGLAEDPRRSLDHHRADLGAQLLERAIPLRIDVAAGLVHLRLGITARAVAHLLGVGDRLAVRPGENLARLDSC